MNTSTYIEFRKKREIGTIISDTFRFLRSNFKVLLSVFFKTAGIPFILLVAAAFYNSSSTLKFSPEDFGNPFAAFSNPEAILSTIVLYIMMFIYFIFLYAGVLSSVKSYIKNEGVINVSEVISEVKKRSMALLGTGLVKYIFLLIAWMLCVLPGLALFAPLILILPIFIFEEKGLVESFKTAFDIIKEDWVMSAIAIAFGFVLWYLISLVFSLPLIIYFFIKMIAFVEEASNPGDINTLIDLPFIILTAVASLLQYFVYIFMPILAAFVYYNLNEKRNQSGSLDRIDTIGRDNA